MRYILLVVDILTRRITRKVQSAQKSLSILKLIVYFPQIMSPCFRKLLLFRKLHFSHFWINSENILPTEKTHTNFQKKHKILKTTTPQSNSHSKIMVFGGLLHCLINTLIHYNFAKLPLNTRHRRKRKRHNRYRVFSKTEDTVKYGTGCSLLLHHTSS